MDKESELIKVVQRVKGMQMRRVWEIRDVDDLLQPSTSEWTRSWTESSLSRPMRLKKLG